MMFPYFGVKKNHPTTLMRREICMTYAPTSIHSSDHSFVMRFDIFFFFLFTKGCEKKFYCHTFLLTFFVDLLVHEKIYRLNQYHTKARTHKKRCFFKFCLLPSLLLHHLPTTLPSLLCSIHNMHPT